MEPSDGAQWVALDAEAKRRGLTQARRWDSCRIATPCVMHHVRSAVVVSPRSIDEVIENLPTADVAPSRRARSADDELDRVIDDQATRARRGRSSAPSR